MDIQEIKQLIKIVEKSEIDEIELVEKGRKIRISKNSKLSNRAAGSNGAVNPVYVQTSASPPPASETAAQAVAPQAGETAASEKTDKDRYYEIRSPMVGTFYRAPSPEAVPYVEVGDTVSSGNTLCIIEAMKLMNEIQSDYNGRIAKVLVENAQPVEYNQLLFLIEK